MPSVLSRCRVARWRLANMVEEEVGAATSEVVEATLEVVAWGEVMAEGLAEAILAALVGATSAEAISAASAEAISVGVTSAEAILAALAEAILAGVTSAEAILAASAGAILAGRRDQPATPLHAAALDTTPPGAVISLALI